MTVITRMTNKHGLAVMKGNAGGGTTMGVVGNWTCLTQSSSGMQRVASKLLTVQLLHLINNNNNA